MFDRARGLLAPLLVLILWPAAAEEAPALSPRNANYTIDVRLDTERRMLHGRQRVEWRNLQQQPTDELWFHLYWNAWRNDRSSWMLTDELRERSDLRDRVRDEDWGYLIVDAIRLASATPEAPAGADLLQRARFAAPDDGNPDDRTVLVVDLPEPVGPGQSVEVELDWRAKIPRTFARTGYRGDFYFIAHWFPKLGVFEPGGWNCHQYHAATEYYSDYGVYRVSITLPVEYEIGATGRRTSEQDNADGTRTHVFEQADVHAFSWTASPDYVVRQARFEEPGLPAVDLRLLIQPEHLGQAERHFAATRAALRSFGTWYGPYPYGHLTIVDPAYGSGAGGMEYPTLFTCGTRLFNPPGGDAPESVTVHEAGHQFWYGIVGNNEFEHAWIDEGLNTFSTIRTLEAAYGPRLWVRRYLPPPGEKEGRRGLLPVLRRDIEVPRWIDRLDRYRPSATSDIPATETFRYYPRTAGDITYSKTALWLATLERHLGWDTLQRILSTFFTRYSFAHPTPRDFLAVAQEVSGQDLGWFFDEVFFGSAAFDYAVTDVASEPAAPRGFVERDGELVLAERPQKPEADGALYRTEVVVRRLGGGVFPVDVLLAFDDGHEIRVAWDGRARHRSIVVERPARLERAVVDPERVLLLDIDYTNNSRLREPRSTLPAVKWGSKWLVWFQDFLATVAFFV